jgi:DegV family protein with EDD domain
MKIAVVTDSSAYIPESATAGLPIHVMPVWLLWDDDRYRDGVDIDPETFYQRLRVSKSMPTSSQPSAGEFEQLFRQLAAEYDAIVCVLVSARISGTLASAMSARANLQADRSGAAIDIQIVDAQSSSMGLGLAVLAAARAAAVSGATPDEVAAVARAMVARVEFLFVVDTLEFLQRGGRISLTKRLLGTALQIKPLLHFEEGQIVPLTQARTKRKALELLLDLAEERLAGRPMAEAAVADIDCCAEGDSVAARVRARFDPPLLPRAMVSPVVGTHVGPGAIGFAFYAD